MTMHHNITPALLISRAAGMYRLHASSALSKIILNISLGAGFCWANDDLLVESVSQPGIVHTVSAGICDCQARRRCWHMELAALLLELEAQEAQPVAALGYRLAVARRAMQELT